MAWYGLVAGRLLISEPSWDKRNVPSILQQWQPLELHMQRLQGDVRLAKASNTKREPSKSDVRLEHHQHHDVSKEVQLLGVECRPLCPFSCTMSL